MRIMALPGSRAPAPAGASASAATTSAAAASRRVVPRLTTASPPRSARDGCAVTGWFGADARAVRSPAGRVRYVVLVLRRAGGRKSPQSVRPAAPNHPLKRERADVREAERGDPRTGPDPDGPPARAREATGAPPAGACRPPPAGPRPRAPARRPRAGPRARLRPGRRPGGVA